MLPSFFLHTHTQIEADPIFRKKKLIPWIGGKHLLARRIIELFPEHTTYCEVFAGGASVFWQKPPSKVEILNDINKEIINLYRVVQNHFEEFLRYARWFIKSRDEFERLKNLPPEYLTDIQRAVRFFYIIKNTFGAKFEGSLSFSTDKYANCKVVNATEIIELLKRAHERLKKVTLECLDWRECIQKYDWEGVLFYCDPPYYGCENYYGKGIWERANYEELASVLGGIKGKFILSINDMPEIRKLFQKFVIFEVKTNYTISTKHAKSHKRVKELLIMNFEPRRSVE